MNILFIADPLETFAIYKDSTFAMMREAQARGHSISACEVHALHWSAHSHSATPHVSATVRDIAISTDLEQVGANWFEEEQAPSTRRRVALKDFDAVLMRKDPPFDSEYFYATHLLAQAEREGARVFNRPSALREHPEKLAIMEFPQYIAPTLVTRSAQDIRAFHGSDLGFHAILQSIFFLFLHLPNHQLYTFSLTLQLHLLDCHRNLQNHIA